jgi:hypothetical protein
MTQAIPATMIKRALVAGILFALALPAGAGARHPVTLAPPGNPGVWQYLEVVPTDSGSKPSTSGGPPGGVLTPRQTRRLKALGTAGSTLAALVNQTAPAPLRALRAPRRRASLGARLRVRASATSGVASTQRPAGSPVNAAPAASPIGSLLSAAFGGSGVGYLLAAAIVAAALALAAQFLVRLRRRRAP